MRGIGSEDFIEERVQQHGLRTEPQNTVSTGETKLADMGI
jgi:hypothetical protein